jgi:hypothetical protein
MTLRPINSAKTSVAATSPQLSLYHSIVSSIKSAEKWFMLELKRAGHRIDSPITQLPFGRSKPTAATAFGFRFGSLFRSNPPRQKCGQTEIDRLASAWTLS